MTFIDKVPIVQSQPSMRPLPNLQDSFIIAKPNIPTNHLNLGFGNAFMKILVTLSLVGVTDFSFLLNMHFTYSFSFHLDMCLPKGKHVVHLCFTVGPMGPENHMLV